MKLMTKDLQARFSKVGRQGKDPLVIAHYFNPMGRGDWYATEYDPKDGIFFGYVSIFGDFCDEWGDFSLSELESVKVGWGLSNERDLHFDEAPISQVVPKAIV